MTVAIDPVVGRAVTLDDGRLRVRVLPDHGADIASVYVVERDLELLFQTPWGRRDRRHLPPRTSTYTAWMDGYGGGWQVLCPNAGFACEGDGGVEWGYHGEACRLAWQLIDADSGHAELQVDLLCAPLRLRRRITLAGGMLRVAESLTNLSPRQVEAMWVQHPAFGAPLVDGARIETSARRVFSDPEIPGDVVPAATSWPWPQATDRDGAAIDLSQLPSAGEPRALLAYLADFPAAADPEAAIVNDRLGLRAGLRWSADPWPAAWLWQEVHATPGHPWFGRAHVCAIEPASTTPALGAQRARELGGRLTRVPAGETHEGWIELSVTATEGLTA